MATHNPRYDHYNDPGMNGVHYTNNFSANDHPSEPFQRLQKIQFVRVLFEKPDKVIAELDPEEVSYGGTLSWELLTEEAHTYSDFAGFRFIDTLYLSPRDNQDLAIRSQATLTAAIKDFSVGAIAVFTTRLRNEDRMAQMFYDTE